MDKQRDKVLKIYTRLQNCFCYYVIKSVGQLTQEARCLATDLDGPGSIPGGGGVRIFSLLRI